MVDQTLPKRPPLKQQLLDMTALPTMRREGYYILVLVGLALAGQLFASYDFNLLVLTIPDIAKSLHLSSTKVGLLVFFIYGGEFVITLFAGYWTASAASGSGNTT